MTLVLQCRLLGCKLLDCLLVLRVGGQPNFAADLAVSVVDGDLLSCAKAAARASAERKEIAVVELVVAYTKLHMQETRPGVARRHQTTQVSGDGNVGNLLDAVRQEVRLCQSGKLHI